jgi:site-specific DNA-cytosine methylase
MRKLVGASFYSGVGCADLGMLQGGVAELAWACEYDAVTADWHEANFGKHILRSPTGSCLGVCDINPYRVERPNVLWLSPECNRTYATVTRDRKLEKSSKVCSPGSCRAYPARSEPNLPCQDPAIVLWSVFEEKRAIE